MKVELLAVESTLNSRTERKLRCAFDAEAVAIVREAGSFRDERGCRTKIVLKGDRHEHQVIETELAFEDVLALIGWSTAGGGSDETS